MDTAGLLGHFLSADEGARRINDAAAFPVAIYQREGSGKPILIDAAATDADAEKRLVEWSAMLLPGAVLYLGRRNSYRCRFPGRWCAKRARPLSAYGRNASRTGGSKIGAEGRWSRVLL